LVFAGIACLAWWLIGGLDWLQQGWFAKTRWDEWLLSGVGSILVLLVGWFTFPIIVTAMCGVFLEPLADRIERRHYPTAPTPRQVPLSEQIHSSLRVLLRGIGWNLLALPFYLGCGAIGAAVSVEAMAAATALASAASTLLTMGAVRHRVGISMPMQMSPTFSSSLMPVVSAVGALPAALWYALAGAPSWAALLLGSAGAAAGAALGLAVRGSPLRREVLRAWRDRRSPAEPAAPTQL
jgi:hypothetical protein